MNREKKIKKVIKLLNPNEYRISSKIYKGDSMFDYYIYLYFSPKRLANVLNYFKGETGQYHEFEMFLQDLFFKNERVAFMIGEIE